MLRWLPPTLVNPISLLGATIAVFALVITLILLVLGATGTIANPYTGILTFLLGPGALALGLFMIPIGAIREGRRLARLGVVPRALPALDLNDPGQRRTLVIFAAVTAGILSFMATTTWGAAEFMESREFCAEVCHRVMEPEGAAYASSPHARVTCVSCHIGPGAPWLVRSKISGLRQVFNYTFNTYERPINVPIEDLRPSRDTCEQCHWPERFYGDRLRSFVHFAPDEKNTFRSQPLVFRVGGSEQGQGVHWHTTAKVWYLPLDEDRSEIGWVKVERPDGSTDEFVLADKKDQVTQERIQREQRFMDCIDCHNRAAHNFPPIEDEVDAAMLRGAISPDVPFIKRQIMQSIGDVRAQLSEEQYRQTMRRIEAIEDYYRTQQAQAYSQYGPQIKRAVAEASSIYRRSVFPDMDVAPGIYPDWRRHDGCMRCHGKLTGTTGTATGRNIGALCLSCHYPSQVAPPPPAEVPAGTAPQQAQRIPILPAVVTHSVQGRGKCTACHQPGAAGAGAPGGLGMPSDHRGRADDTCLGCHALSTITLSQPPSASPAPAPPAAAPPAKTAGPAAIPHPLAGREACSSCHQAGGAGVGAPGGLGMPADHQGRPDTTCTGCHKAA